MSRAFCAYAMPRAIPSSSAVYIGKRQSYLCRKYRANHNSKRWFHCCAAHQRGPAPAEDGRNKPAMVAYLAASAIISALTYRQLSSSEVPVLPPWAPWVPAYTGCAAVVAMGTLKLLMGDLFHITWHKGRLYLQLGVPSQGPAMAAGSVEVRPTGDARGNGAYATRTIPAGSFVVSYEGEQLSWDSFGERYPSGVSDYVMGVDKDWCLDASHLVADTSQFSAVHMNHSRSRANVVRYYDYTGCSVLFFASRDIQPGEELLFDYGRSYWMGREHLELP